MDYMPLRYNISDWHQLSRCLSNNSKDLQIIVKDLVHNSMLSGLVIQVHHPMFGVVFCCTLYGRGSLVSTPAPTDLTTEQVLTELQRFGFFVTFNEREHLPGSMLSYLITLQGLEFDKIRTLYVYNNKTSKYDKLIVAFNVGKCPAEWLDINHRATAEEFYEMILDSGAVNVTDTNQASITCWDWLDYVANISDVLADNSGV